MYQNQTSLILGFHGCDREKGKALLTQDKPFILSSNQYDWLGNGMYFWESNHSRASDYAYEVKSNPAMGEITDPYVIGAVIDLGHCLDLMEHNNLQLLKKYYALLVKNYAKSGMDIPKNNIEKKLHYLDRAVIELMHDEIKNGRNIDDLTPFDSVRASYIEGDALYPNAGFNDKNHIQLCIRNPNCIKGFFLPRKHDGKHVRI